MKHYFRYVLIISILLVIACKATVLADVSYTIDPSNTGNHFAEFVHAPLGGSAEINFGKFSAEPNYNISISGGALHGYAWSPVAGWIVMNCADASGGCSSNNQNFKVSVSGTGVLSGYAWGQQTGWVNFGPFNNSNTPQVQISSNGAFGGAGGNTAGYAWSATYGWIVFDCSSVNSCVNSSFISIVAQGGGGLSGGSLPPVTIPSTPIIVPPTPPVVSPIVPKPPTHTAPASSQPSTATTPVTQSSAPLPASSLQPSSPPSNIMPTTPPPATKTSILPSFPSITPTVTSSSSNTIKIEFLGFILFSILTIYLVFRFLRGFML